MSIKSFGKFVAQYCNFVQIGQYVPCDMCGKLHDDGGILPYKNDIVYVCMDCLDKVDDEIRNIEK